MVARRQKRVGVGKRKRDSACTQHRACVAACLVLGLSGLLLGGGGLRLHNGLLQLASTLVGHGQVVVVHLVNETCNVGLGGLGHLDLWCV